MLIALSTPAQLNVPGLTPATSGAIAKITGANMTLTTDQLFTWLIPTPSLYIPRRILATRASGAFGVACAGGLYTGAGKTGVNVVLAVQSWAALTGANTYVDASIIALATTNILISPTLYLALTTGNTGALTADIYLWGDVLA